MSCVDGRIKIPALAGKFAGGFWSPSRSFLLFLEVEMIQLNPMRTSFLASASAIADANQLGFRFGAKGTHTSRTIMFNELDTVLTATQPTATRADYATAIIQANCLGKTTTSTRRLTNQRLSELYALDSKVPLFRVLRRLWSLEPDGRRLLALQCALARDPLLMATAPSIIDLPIGAEFLREPLRLGVLAVVGDRLSPGTLAKVVRNAASSWTQSGHLAGRTLKRRRVVQPTAANAAFATLLSHATGFRGAQIFSSAWFLILDCSPPSARELALEAKRLGLLDLRISGDVIELALARLDPVAAP